MRIETARPSFEGASPRDLNLRHFAIQRALTRCALVGDKLYRRSKDEDPMELGDVDEVIDDGRGLTVKAVHGELPRSNNDGVRLFYEFDEIDGRHGIHGFSPLGRFRDLVGALRLLHGRLVFLPCRYRYTRRRDFASDHVPEPDGTILEIAVPASRTGALSLLYATHEYPSTRRQVEAFLDTRSEFAGLFGRFAFQEIDARLCVVGCDAFGIEASMASRGTGRGGDLRVRRVSGRTLPRRRTEDRRDARGPGRRAQDHPEGACRETAGARRSRRRSG